MFISKCSVRDLPKICLLKVSNLDVEKKLDRKNSKLRGWVIFKNNCVQQHLSKFTELETCDDEQQIVHVVVKEALKKHFFWHTVFKTWVAYIVKRDKIKFITSSEQHLCSIYATTKTFPFMSELHVLCMSPCNVSIKHPSFFWPDFLWTIYLFSLKYLVKLLSNKKLFNYSITLPWIAYSHFPWGCEEKRTKKKNNNNTNKKR